MAWLLSNGEFRIMSFTGKFATNLPRGIIDLYVTRTKSIEHEKLPTPAALPSTIEKA